MGGKTIGRTATGPHDLKLREVVHRDLWNYTAVEHYLIPAKDLNYGESDRPYTLASATGSPS
jgi:hypothetical protein